MDTRQSFRDLTLRSETYASIEEIARQLEHESGERAEHPRMRAVEVLVETWVSSYDGVFEDRGRGQYFYRPDDGDEGVDFATEGDEDDEDDEERLTFSLSEGPPSEGGDDD